MLNQISQPSAGGDGAAANSGDDMKKLSDDDRRAVDMLLDRDGGHVGGNGNGSEDEPKVVAAMDGQFQHRIGKVEALLNLFGEMPAAEPPADLLKRVMQRIDETPQHLGTAAAAAASSSTIDARRTHA